MPARSFARRMLTPARAMLLRRAAAKQQQQQLGFFTSSINQDEQDWRGNHGVRIAHTEGFFYATPPHLNTQASSSSSSSNQQHPLMRELLRELYSTTPNPERVWRAYVAIHEYQAQMSGARSAGVHESSVVQLKASHHVQVLRAIAPDVQQRRKAKQDQRRRLQKLPVMHATPGSPFAAPSNAEMRQPTPAARPPSLVAHRSGGQGSSSTTTTTSFATYMQRVDFVFAQMQQASRDSASFGRQDQTLPSVLDYNHVLEVVAQGGHISALTSLWSKLVASSSSDTQQRGPNLHSYTALMLGLSRHLANSIQHAHQSAMRHRRSASAEEEGIIPHSARNAALVAARRAIGLLDDMWARQIKPDKLTLDYAARMLRLAGHVQGLTTLLKVAYGVDLDHPDVKLTPRKQSKTGRMSVHTLNTILMLLGEQDSVARMIVAYETLVRPLPLGAQANMQTQSHVENSKGLFKLDWSALSSRSDSTSAPSDASTPVTTAEVPQTYVHPFAIQPNTTTFTHLIRHACTFPTKSLVVSPRTAAGSAPASSILEMRKRNEAAYLGIAQYLAKEVVQLYEAEVARMASELGVWCPDLPAWGRKRNQWERVAELRERERERQEDEVASVVASQATSSTSSTSTTPPFTPFLNPPHLAPTPELFLPLVGLIGKTYSTSLLQWAEVLLRRATLARQAEVLVLQRARQRWGRHVQLRQAELRQASLTVADGDARVQPSDTAAAADPATQTLQLDSLRLLHRALTRSLSRALQGVSELSTMHADKAARLQEVRAHRHLYSRRRLQRKVELQQEQEKEEALRKATKEDLERVRRAEKARRDEDRENQTQEDVVRAAPVGAP